MKNKKGAIGATMTWVVATIIIIVIIVIFVYAAKVQSIGSGNIFFYTRYKLTEIDKQQTLLALLKTEIDSKKIADYIKSGDYDELESKIKPILENLPGPSDGNWVFIIYEDDKEKLKIGKTSIYAKDINPSFVYYSDKKVVLDFDYFDRLI